MAVNDLFKKVPIEVPNKSGFDESHEHFFTAKVGTLVPVMTDLLLPNDTVSLGVSAEIQLPPMATDFYGRVKAHFEQFFVPCRLLYGGWQDLITSNYMGGYLNLEQSPTAAFPKYLPTLRIPMKEMQAGSLSDYLGYGFEYNETYWPNATVDVFNPLKYLAYHKIWNDYYRDSRIQKPCFQKQPSAENQSDYLGGLPWFSYIGSSPEVLGSEDSDSPSLELNDSFPVYSLRQRNWARDYFTNGTPLPQAGDPARVAFGIDNNQGSFSIQSLRAANSLQMWLERNNVAGFRYGDQIRAHFGIYPSDAALDRPLYLGRQIFDVYNKSVFQNDGSSSESNSNNPFSTVAAKYGSPLGVGSGELCGKFTASEHGYLMTIFSLVPDAIYSDTIDKDFWYNNYASFPFPLLQGVGDEPISYSELIGSKVASQTVTDPQTVLADMGVVPFAYTQRYANHKFKLDRVSGLLKDNQNLQSFALQRSFEWSTDIQEFNFGSDFLEIPTDYLDQVSAVNGDVSKYGCWVDAHFNYHKVSTLSAYSIPTLGEPKNTHTEVIPNGGTRL